MKRLFLLLLVIAIAAVGFEIARLPDVKSLRRTNPTRTSLMNLRDTQAGRPQGAKIQWISLEKVSPYLVHAVLLAEDDVFYHHKGFDLVQIREALRINWEKRRYAYGGSTLSQQLARTLYLTPRKTLWRKFREALITFQLERQLSKTRILEIYLNVVEWGRGVYGAEAAAQTYFEKSAADLTADEAVALASVLPSPRRWNPRSERAFMARRRTQLMERMRKAGYLPQDLDEIDAQNVFNFEGALIDTAAFTTEVSSETVNKP